LFCFFVFFCLFFFTFPSGILKKEPNGMNWIYIHFEGQSRHVAQVSWRWE
jgi:hypothetical protein